MTKGSNKQQTNDHVNSKNETKISFFSRRNKNRNWIGMRKEIDFIFVTLVHLLATHFTLSYFTWTRKQCCWWFLCYCVYFFRTFSFFSPHQQPMCTWCSGAYFFSLCTQCTEHADELKSTKERRSSRNEHEKMHQSQVSIYGAHSTHTGAEGGENAIPSESKVYQRRRKAFFLVRCRCHRCTSSMIFFIHHFSPYIQCGTCSASFSLARSIGSLVGWHWHALKENVKQKARRRSRSEVEK